MESVEGDHFERTLEIKTVNKANHNHNIDFPQDHIVDDNEENDENIDVNENETLEVETTDKEDSVSEACSNADVDDNIQSSILLSWQSKCQQLQQQLGQKDDFIALQKRELDLLEKEKTAIRRILESSQKEKESAVVRYAMLEKNILDLKNVNDQSNRRLKEAQKEIEALTARLKFVINEKDRSNKELRKCITQCEGLKTDFSLLESKHKWCPVKLKQELIEKSALETKINDLTQQVAQLNEYRQQNIDNIKYEEKAVEAQLILLKHKHDEKDKENVNLTAKITELKMEGDSLSEKLRTITVQHDELQIKFTATEELLSEKQEVCSNQEESIKNLTEKLEETQVLLREQLILGEENLKELKDLKHIRSAYQEHQQETAKVRSREEHLMTLTKDLTEKSVSLESKLILTDSKCTALCIENKKIKETYEKHRQRINELEEELTNLRDKHQKDLESIQLLTIEKTQLNVSLQSQLDNTIGELEASRRKNAQIIKELNRELIVLRAKLDPKPPNSQTGNQTEIKEPSKKSLIDRIVRLQRALAKQTEKNEFLENHCAALVNQLKVRS